MAHGLLNDLRWQKRLAYLAVALPVLRWIYLIATEQLGTNPTEFLIRSTGIWTLVALWVTLAITPIRRLTGWHQLLKLRRLFGVTSFCYALLHLTTYVWFDQWFDLGDVLKDTIKRPFIMLGMLAFTLMIPLALTSSNAAVRWLGGKRWQALHRWVYLIGIAAAAHFWWQRTAKNTVQEPAIYAAILTLLLLYRVLFAWFDRRKKLRLASAQQTQVRP